MLPALGIGSFLWSTMEEGKTVQGVRQEAGAILQLRPDEELTLRKWL